MFDAKPGFMLLQSAYGFIAFHQDIIANPADRFHGFARRPGQSATCPLTQFRLKW